MFRALLWKEWRQLRMLRWVGSLLIVVAPPFLILVSEASARGWVFSSPGSSYTMETLVLDALPLVMGIASVLFATMFVAQAYAGDRAIGTESFLLERPVSRSRVWSARFLAALGSSFVLVIASTLAWAAYASLLADPSGAQWIFGLKILVVAAGGSILLFFVGTMAAASLLGSPMVAVLLGMILASVPVGVAALLGGAFPWAAVRGVPIGIVLPVLLLPCFVVTSWLVSCRGEPGGRGRYLRGGSTLASGIVGALVLFVAIAPLIVRAGARSMQIPPETIPSAAGGEALFASPFGGWIVDIETAERGEFFGPMVYSAGWDPGGRWLAVVTDSGPLGSSRFRLRVDFYDAMEGRVTRSVALPDDWTWVNRLEWVGAELILASRSNLMRILQVSPERDGFRTLVDTAHLDAHRRHTGWSLIGPTDKGLLYLATDLGLDREGDAGSGERVIHLWNRPFQVFPIDLHGDGVGSDPVLQAKGGHIHSSGRLMSRSGRHWFHVEHRLDASDEYVDSELSIQDLESGQRIPIGVSSIPFLGSAWLDGEILVWIDGRGAERVTLRSWRPGQEPRVLREIAHSGEKASVYLDASPDGMRALITVRERVEDSGSEDPEPPELLLARALVYDPRGETWVELTGRPQDRVNPYFSTYWAGPKTVACTGDGFIALEDVDDPGNLRYVLGGP
jgi:ABC-type transport system involved in multi-copper enzyme maturation permease subunit